MIVVPEHPPHTPDPSVSRCPWCGTPHIVTIMPDGTLSVKLCDTSHTPSVCIENYSTTMWMCTTCITVPVVLRLVRLADGHMRTFVYSSGWEYE